MLTNSKASRISLKLTLMGVSSYQSTVAASAAALIKSQRDVDAR
jgi:hypothetical protein